MRARLRAAAAFAGARGNFRAGRHQAGRAMEKFHRPHARRFARARAGRRYRPIWRFTRAHGKCHRLFSHRKNRRPLVARGSRRRFVFERRRGLGQNHRRAGRRNGAGKKLWQQIRLGAGDGGIAAHERLQRHGRVERGRFFIRRQTASRLHAFAWFHGGLRQNSRRHAHAARPRRLSERLHFCLRSTV